MAQPLYSKLSFFDDVLTEEELSQTAILMHLFHDIAPADELAFDVHLGNGGPIRVGLDCAAKVFVGQHIHVQVVFDSVRFHKQYYVAAEAALGHLVGAFHENYDIVLGDPLRDCIVQFVV